MLAIKIIQADNGGIAFQPDRPNAQPGQPLGARNGDLVTWNNMTDGTLSLQSIDPPNVYITDPIPAGSVSSPVFQVSGNLTYSCVDPPQPQHRIVVPGTV